MLADYIPLHFHSIFSTVVLRKYKEKVLKEILQVQQNSEYFQKRWIFLKNGRLAYLRHRCGACRFGGGSSG